MTESLLNIVLVAQESTSWRLKRTLDSALQQTYAPKTVWVVNAKPSDKDFTLGLLEDLKAYPQVRLLPVAGQGTRFYFRNRALAQADGEFIAFIGDVDVWEPGKAAAQVERLQAQPDACAVFSNALVLRETPYGVVGSAVFETATADPQDWMLYKTVSYGSQVVYRTEALRAAGGFDETFSVYGDLDALLRLQESQTVLCSQQIPVKVHIPPQQDLAAKQYADNRYLLEKHLDFFLTHKRMAYMFYRGLARQSFSNRQWILTVFYGVRAVLKQPLHSFLHMIGRTLRALWTLLRKALRTLYIVAAIRRLHMRISSGRPQRLPGPPDSLRGKAPVSLETLHEHEFVRFPSMKFMFDRRLEYVKIPDYVSVIPRGMFFGCKRLLAVNIPETVTRIEANAFQNCVRLKTVRFAYGSMLESIGAYAFAGCVSLSEISLSASLRTLGRGAFAGCCNLPSVPFTSLRGHGDESRGFSSSLRVIQRSAFAGCSAMKSLVFESGSMLEKIETGAFYRCSELEMLKITGNVTAIGQYAFAECARLSFLDMQAIDSVRSIGRRAFENCRSLSNFYIPYSIRNIRPFTFRGCTALRRVKIPVNVKRVGRGAFAGCRLLAYVTLMDDTTVYRRSSFPRQATVAPYKPLDAEQTGRSVAN